jgi:hypothetical protein
MTQHAWTSAARLHTRSLRSPRGNPRKLMHIREKRWREKRLRERVIRKARRCSLTAREIFWFNCRWLIHFWSRCWLVVEVLVYIFVRMFCVFIYIPPSITRRASKSLRNNTDINIAVRAPWGALHIHTDRARESQQHTQLILHTLL